MGQDATALTRWIGLHAADGPKAASMRSAQVLLSTDANIRLIGLIRPMMVNGKSTRMKKTLTTPSCATLQLRGG